MKPLTLNASQKVKKTPLGEIPVDWVVRSLREVFGVLEAGTSVNSEDRPARPPEKGVLKVSAATWEGFKPEQNKVVVRGDLDRCSVTPKAGSIIVSRANTHDLVGAATYVARDFPNLFLSDKLWQGKSRDETLYSTRWLSYALIDQRIREEMIALATGTSSSMKNISQAAFLAIAVAVPPIGEQYRIAEILSTWDSAISNTDRLTTTKQRLKSGVMQQLLIGKRRSNVWKTYHLGELFDERVEIGRGDLPLLSITGVRGIVNRDDLDKKDTSNADKGKYLRIAPGDIGYNTMRMWQGVSALSELEGIISPAYTVCIPKTEKIDGRFAAHLFKYPSIVHRFWRYSQGMVDDTLNLKFHNFAQIRVEIPPLEQQGKIVAVLSGCDRELGLLERKLDALREQKKGLMQMLLTGKIRVNAQRGL